MCEGIEGKAKGVEAGRAQAKGGGGGWFWSAGG